MRDTKTIKISVVIPVFFGDSCLADLAKQLVKILKKQGVTFEIILVEDGSSNSSWICIKSLCSLFPEISGFRLSRNFGQHYAISAGLQKACGEWIIVMDCDLQDQPSEIPKLFAKANEGFDIVLARRALRQDNWWKRASSSAFHNFLGWLTDTRWDPSIANFGIYSKKVIHEINKMPENIRYFPAMVRWVGFSKATVEVQHAPRRQGKSTYSLAKLLSLAIDICLANSDKPLRLVVGSGFFISSIGFLFAIYTIVKAWRGAIEVTGYASLIVSIWSLAGLTILIVGVVGLYVGKAFEGIKNRPAFIIAEEIKSRKYKRESSRY